MRRANEFDETAICLHSLLLGKFFCNIDDFVAKSIAGIPFRRASAQTMYNFNGPALLYTVGVLLLAVVVMLILSFDDTIRGFLQFWNFKRRFSLRSLIYFLILVPPFVAFTYKAFLSESPVFVLGYLGVLLLFLTRPAWALFYGMFDDVFGATSSKRWGKFMNRKVNYRRDEVKSPLSHLRARLRDHARRRCSSDGENSDAS